MPVNIESIEKTHQANLLKAVPNLKKDNPTRIDLEDGIRWLVSSGTYDAAEYFLATPDQFQIRASKTKRIHAIKIRGNKSIGDYEVKAAFGVSESASFDSENLLEAAQKIQVLYRDQGFYKALIDLEFAPYNKNEYDVLINITENIQSKFSQFKFDTPNPELERRLKNLVSGHLNEAYSPNAVKLMSKEILAFFAEKHYIRAELSEPKIQSSNDDSQVSVEYKIEHPESYFIDAPEKTLLNFSEVTEAIGLSLYTSNSPNLAQELAAKIKAYYISQAYSRVEVAVKDVDGVEPYHRRLKFEILEGPRVQIEKIEFTGRLSKPEEYYVNQLYDFASPVMANHRFVKEDLDKALKSLVIESQNNGYFKAKIISVRTSFNKDHDAVSISVNLDEGPLTQIQKITFMGNEQIPEAQLQEQLKLKPLDQLRLSVLEKGIENIKKYYHDLGYLEAQILNEKNEKDELITYNEDNTLANLSFRIFEGPRVYVGSVVVEGNSITKDYVILKELEFKPGDILTPALIDESISRMQRIGIFNSIEIKTLEEKTLVSRRTVLVRVSDRNPGLFSTGIGYTNHNQLGGTVRGYLGYAYRNIGGMARLFSARADLDDNIANNQYLEKKAALGYLQPYLFDSRMRGRATLTNATYISDYSVLSTQDVFQVTFSLEQAITSHLLVRWDLWNWARYINSSVNNNLPVTNVLIGSTGPTFELDYRDNPFNPTKGTFTRLNLEYGSPGLLQSSANVSFERSMLSMTHNLAVYKKIVWANQLRGGYLKNLLDADQGGYTPWPQKGFLLGGPTTIRGFSDAEAFPNSKDFGGNSSYQLTSDASMYLIKSELRIPIKGNFGTLLFYDGGAVNITGFNYGFGFRSSAGIGILYYTPVGPASFDIGWKLNEIGKRGEQPLAIDISIGSF